MKSMPRRIQVTFVFTVILTVGFAYAKDKNVVVQTNKFTGKTTITMNEILLKRFGTELVKVSAVSTLDAPNEVGLVFHIRSLAWHFADGGDVHILEDGQRIDLGHFANVDSRLVQVGSWTEMSEMIAASIDRTLFEQIISGKVLELEVGTYQMKVEQKNIEKLREFAQALPKR